jgi:hypothetical protein
MVDDEEELIKRKDPDLGQVGGFSILVFLNEPRCSSRLRHLESSPGSAGRLDLVRHIVST